MFSDSKVMIEYSKSSGLNMNKVHKTISEISLIVEITEFQRHPIKI